MAINPSTRAADQGASDPSTLTEATTPASSATRTIRQELFWLIPVGLTIVGATAYLLLHRSWGADAAQILSLCFASVGFVFRMLIKRGSLRWQPLRVPRGRGRTWRFTLAFTMAIVAVTSLVWWVQREGDPFDYLSGEVRIGYTGAYAPGWHGAANGIPVGFDVDVAHAIQSHFKFDQVTWVELGSLENRMSALEGAWRDPSGRQQKPVKLVISNFSMNPARAERIDFAGPYFVDTQAFLSRTPASTIADIPTGTVCVTQGSTTAERLVGWGWHPTQRPSLAACINEYQAKTVDAVSGDRSTLVVYAASTGQIPPLALDAGTEKYGVGMPNNMPKLCGELSKVLDDFLTYQWVAAFRTNLQPVGLKESEFTKPPSVDHCHQPAPFTGG